MRTIKTKIYKFDELSKDAQETATDNYSYSAEFLDADDVIETLKKFAEHFDSKLLNYEIDWMQGTAPSWVRFEQPDHDETGNEYTEWLKERIAAMGMFDKETMRGDGQCLFTGVMYDEDVAEGARIAYHNGERDLKTILERGAKKLLDAAKSQFEHQVSVEGYAELCEANDYEFTEDGTRWRG